MEPADLRDVHRALVQQWGIWAIEGKRIARDAILDELARRVDFLLKHDFDRLMSCMYTIDVAEQRFSEALKLPEKDKPARAIAQLILEREIEKMESRKRYARADYTDVSVCIEGRPSASTD